MNTNEQRARLAVEYGVPESAIYGADEQEMRSNVESIKATRPELFDSQRDKEIRKEVAARRLSEYMRGLSAPSVEEAINRREDK